MNSLKKGNRMLVLSDQKGFAMLFALFLIVLATAVIAAGFLNMNRHARIEIREVKTTQTRWAAESVIDRAVKLFRDHLSVKGIVPLVESPGVYDNTSQVLNPIYGSPAVPHGAETFAHYLMNAWLTERSTGFFGDSKASHPVWSDIALTVSIFQTGPAVSRRTPYEIDVTARSKANGAETRLIQNVEVGAGKLFDFGVFYDDDLEISPGPEFTIQGPVFSNANVYLMPGRQQKTMLTTPDDITGPAGVKDGIGEGNGDYALKSAGNIYFYFKRALGKNYFTGTGGNFSAAISSAYASYWKDPADAEISGIPYTFGMLLNGTASDLLTETGLPASWGWGQDLPIYTPPIPQFYFFHNENNFQATCSLADAANCPDGSGGIDSTRVPLRPGKYDANHPLSLKDVTGGTEIPLYPRIFREIDLFRGNMPDNAGPGRTEFPAIRSVFFDTKSYSVGTTADSDHFMSVSPAFSLTNMPRMLKDWDIEDPASTNPEVNPYWESTISGILGSHGQRLIADKQPKVSIPLGTTATGPNAKHIIIEPKLASDTPDEISAKLAYKADYSVECGAHPACTDFTIKDSSGVAVPGLNAAITLVTLKDLRLSTTATFGGANSFQTISVDLAQVLAFLQGAGIDKRPEGFIFYIETGSLTNGADPLTSIRDVELINGTALPPNGLTVVTNGRLWVRGDYNTVEYDASGTATGDLCDAANFDAKKCNDDKGTLSTADDILLPPAAVMSDSFGILSNHWLDSYAGSDPPKVDSDLIFNAAMVTGFVQSQLQKAFPNCDGIDIAKCIYDGDDAFPLENHPVWTVSQYARWSKHLPTNDNNQFLYKDKNWQGADGPMPPGFPDGKTPWPGTVTSRGGFFAGRDSNWCVDGYDRATGYPVDPDNCYTYQDLSTGFYYWRRSMALHGAFATIYHDEARYYNNYVSYFPDLPIDLGYGAGTQKLVDIRPTNMDGSLSPDCSALPSPKPGACGKITVFDTPTAAMNALMAPYLDPAVNNMDFKDGDASLSTLETNLNNLFRNQPFQSQMNLWLPWVSLCNGPEAQPANTTDSSKPDFCDVSNPANYKVLIKFTDPHTGVVSYYSRKYIDVITPTLANPLNGLGTGETVALRHVNPEIKFPRKRVSYFADKFIRCTDDVDANGNKTYPTWRWINDNKNPPSGDNCEVRSAAPIPGMQFAQLAPADLYFVGPYLDKTIVIDPGSPGGQTCTTTVVIGDGETTPRFTYTTTCVPDASQPPVPPTLDVYKGRDFFTDSRDYNGRHYPAGFTDDGKWTYEASYGGAYIPLYYPKYSGGLENLINLQEQWFTSGADFHTLRFLGATIVPWHSEELRKPTHNQDPIRYDPAYYDSSPTIYTAPKRNFDYNETLVNRPPPGSPSIFSVSRTTFSEEKIDS